MTNVTVQESSLELHVSITEHKLKLKTWVHLSALLLMGYQSDRLLSLSLRSLCVSHSVTKKTVKIHVKCLMSPKLYIHIQALSFSHFAKCPLLYNFQNI